MNLKFPDWFNFCLYFPVKSPRGYRSGVLNREGEGGLGGGGEGGKGRM